MRRSTTAMLLSALVLPGAGQLYLKQAPRGLVLIAVSLACLWIIVNDAFQQATIVLDKFQAGDATLDAGRLSELVIQTSSSLASSLATWVLIGCWLVGMIDTYWLGKKTS